MFQVLCLCKFTTLSHDVSRSGLPLKGYRSVSLQMSPSASPFTPAVCEFSLLCLCTLLTVWFFHRSVFPSAILLALTVLSAYFASLLHSSKQLQHPKLRRCSDPIGLACGSLLPLALLPCLPYTGRYAAVAVCTYVIASVWTFKRRAVVSIVLYICIMLLATQGMHHEWFRNVKFAVIATFLPLLGDWLIHTFPHTFTIAESAITSGAIISTFTSSLAQLSNPNMHSLSGSNALDALSTAALLGSTFLLPPLAYCTRHSQIQLVHLIFLLLPPITITYIYALFILRAEPIIYTLLYITAEVSRWGLLLFWTTALWATIVIVRPERHGQRIIARKWYHILSLLIFTVGHRIDASLTRLGAAVALCGMIIGEMCRLCGPPNLKWAMQTYAGKLVDERDQGTIVVTHIYLLVGCAAPMWIGGNSAFEQGGVAMVCVLDSAAAVIGKKWGTWKWGAGKSVQGSLAGVLAAWMWTSGEGWMRMAVGCLVGGAVEAWTEQIDNLVLPMAFCAVVGVWG